jgi:glycosyltransferase involved in cell wall biosynthesis
MSEPLVSIVTPVYNTDKYLAECIESVLAQTYKNWDYLIVNNRSTDKSLEIAESYARKEPRIRIHTMSEFLSLMKNWNHAMRLSLLKASTARWCMRMTGFFRSVLKEWWRLPSAFLLLGS